MCVVKGEEGARTVPQGILDAVEEEGIWWDWTERINKWYVGAG